MQKVQVFAVISEYIEQNIQQMKGPLFDKARSSSSDEQQKLKILSRYNEKLDRFATEYIPGEFDFAIVCDLLLDLYRFNT